MHRACRPPPTWRESGRLATVPIVDVEVAVVDEDPKGDRLASKLLSCRLTLLQSKATWRSDRRRAWSGT